MDPQLLDGGAAGNQADEYRVPYEEIHPHEEGGGEDQNTGELVQQGVLRGKAMELDRREEVAGKAQEQCDAHEPPEPAGEDRPHDGDQQGKGNGVQQQVRGAVQLCPPGAGLPQFPGQISVQHIAHAADGVDDQKSRTQGSEKGQNDGTDHAEKGENVGNGNMQNFCASFLYRITDRTQAIINGSRRLVKPVPTVSADWPGSGSDDAPGRRPGR